MYSARLMFVKSYGLLPKKYYEYFRKLDEPDYYFYKLGKQSLNFWKNELKDLDLVMETELIHVINLVNRNTDHEVVIGITDHAQDALTDIVYIELPGEGETLDDMDEFAIVESVKSASPIFAPLAGEITAVNEALEDTPELMNTDPYGEGWIVKMKLQDPSAVETLMSATDYKSEIGE